jgi:hypothetical protein
MSAEFLVVTCHLPWLADAGRHGLLTDEEIVQIAELRMPRAVGLLRPDELEALDPYYETREPNDPDDEHPPIREAVSEGVLEALAEMLRDHSSTFAETGSGLTGKWVTGGMSSGDAPTESYRTIKALEWLGLFDQSISTYEIEYVRDRIQARRAERMQKRG